MQQACDELMREIKLREGVYATWVEGGKLPVEQANKQFAGLAKAHATIAYMQKNHGDITLGLQLVAMLKKSPQTVGAMFADPAVKALLEAFPGAQLTALREIGKVAA